MLSGTGVFHANGYHTVGCGRTRSYRALAGMFVFLSLLEAVLIGDSPQQRLLLRKNFNFSTSAELDFVRQMKEKFCYVRPKGNGNIGCRGHISLTNEKYRISCQGEGTS